MSRSERPPGRPRDEAAIAARKTDILIAASRHFARTGYRQTDVQHIADSLGVGKGTIYRYFPSKEQLFLAAVDQGMRDLAAAVEQALGDTEAPLELIRRSVHAYLAFFDAHPQVLELLIQERAEFKDRERPTYAIHRDANIGEWRCQVERLIADGVFNDLGADRIIDVMDCTLYGAIFTRHFALRPRSLSEFADDVMETFLQGFLARKSG